MAAALKDKPAIPFRIPPGIRMVRVNATTGQLAEPGDKNVIFEAFKPGTEPTATSRRGMVLTAATPVPTAGTVPASATTDGRPPRSRRAGAADRSAARAMPTQTAPAAGTGGLY